MASIKFIQRTKALKDGTYPIVLRIIKHQKKKIISLNMSCGAGEFKNQEFKRSAINFKQRNKLLAKLKIRAYEILDNFKVDEKSFTLDEFERKFKGEDQKEAILVFDFFNTIIEELNRGGQVGNARAYVETRNSLFKFASPTLTFKEITPGMLERYEVFMRARGNQDGGISFKMRTLRSLFNKAIVRELVSRDIYPFQKYKISKLKKQGVKRALSIEEFKLFKDVDLTMLPHLVDAHNYFLFSFYTRGMNFVDMMKLKWGNIQNGKIFYIRSKTKGSFNIEILPMVQQLLDYYSAQKRPTSYVFPILLKEGLNEKQIADRKKKTLRRYNANLKAIAKIVGVSQNMTSYVARHSYATILKQKGISMDLISESMGHADLQVTMTYLKAFDNVTLDEANSKLLDI